MSAARYIVWPPGNAPPVSNDARGGEATNMASGHYIYRDAVTGRLVTKEYWEKHPNTTVREWVPDN